MITRSAACALVALLCFSATSLADSPPAPAEAPAAPVTAAVGSPAPDFTLTDTDGKTVTLSSFRGKIVVLEWFNPDCPFVVNAHGEKGVLRSMASAWAAKNVAWLAINSSGEGKQGHGLDRNKTARTGYAMSHPVLLDPAGSVGRSYGAKTTPHVFVIDAKGTLIYKGAVDNAPMGEIPEGSVREPWLQTALEEAVAGKPVTKADTRSYGCSVKYAGP